MDSSPRARARALAAHVLLPSLAPLAMTALALTPVSLLGCVTRGWIAFGLAIVTLALSAGATARAFRTRASNPAASRRWILTALVLLLPAALLLGPLG